MFDIKVLNLFPYKLEWDNLVQYYSLKIKISIVEMAIKTYITFKI